MYQGINGYNKIDNIKLFKKSLKISKGGNQNLYIKEEENTMARRKRAKGQITIYKTYI
jgi:hypothetical protein